MKNWIIVFLFLCFVQVGLSKQYTIRDADNLFKNNQFYEALTIYEQLLRTDHRNKALQLKQARCYLKINSPNNALKILLQLISGTNQFALKSYQQLSDFYINQSQFNKAQKLLEEAHQKFPKNKSFFDSLLFVYESLNNYDKFKTLFLQYPYKKTKDLFYKLITLAVQNNKKSDIKILIAPIQNQILKQELQAYYFRKTNNIEKAEEIYTSLYNKTQNLFYIQELAKMFDENGNKTKAQNIILSILKKDNLSSYNKVVKMLYDFAYYKQAIKLYKIMGSKFSRNYSKQLIALYQLIYDYSHLVQEYIRYLKRTQDVDYISKKMADLVFLDGQEKIVFDSLNKELKTASGDLKVSIHIIFFQIYERSGKENAAKHELIWLASHNVDFYFIKIALNQFIIRGWLHSVKNILQSIIAADYYPENQNFLVLLYSKVQFELGQYKKSLEILDEIPQSDNVLYYKAINLNYLGQYDKSFKILKKISNPKGKILIELALTSILKNDLKNSATYCQQIIKNNEYKSDGLFIQGYIFMMQTNWSQAITTFETIIKSGGASFYAVEALQEIFIIDNIFDQNTNSLIQHLYADSLKSYMSHNYIKTIEGFQKLKSLLPKYQFIWNYKIGNLYVLIGQYTNAVKYFHLVKNNTQAMDYLRASSAEKIIAIQQIQLNSTDALTLYRTLMMEFPMYVRQKEIRETILELRSNSKK